MDISGNLNVKIINRLISGYKFCALESTFPFWSYGKPLKIAKKQHFPNFLGTRKILGSTERYFWKARACSRALGLIYWPGPDPVPVVQEKQRKVKKCLAWTLVKGKTQALVKTQADLELEKYFTPKIFKNKPSNPLYRQNWGPNPYLCQKQNWTNK